MDGGHSIPRRPASKSSDFERLRREGVERIQELSGEIWTDYNLHDPGITILEQLCYGLTDLIYRADFPVEDLLAGPEGTIDFEGQALHRPEVIFPARPTTLDDYRRAVLDAVPEVENVWVDREGDDRPAPDGAPSWNGVYRVRIHLSPDAGDPAAVRARVRAVFLSNRNLGEDVAADVVVAEERHCDLSARIEIAGGRSPEEVLAEVYARARRRVAGEVDVPAPAERRRLEDVFEGPLAPRGVRGEVLLSDASRIHVADLVSLVRDIEGVVGVEDLSLVVDGTHRRESVDRVVDDRVLCLNVPGHGVDEPQVRLVKGGRPVSVAPGPLHRKFLELSDAHRLGARGRTEPTALYDEPRGVNRDDAEYHTVQDHFPAVYGINRYGIPESASAADKARVAQLKAYLLPMEQLLANGMVDIRHLRDLFSTADPDLPTYRYQALVGKKSRNPEPGAPSEAEVPGVGPLWIKPPDEVLAALFRSMDDGGERRSRALDHMLAMYGETFTQRSLRQFDHYGAERMEEVIVRNKIEYLRSVVSVGRDRGGGFDPSRRSWTTSGAGYGPPGAENVSGFQRRVGLLLGFARPGSRSLVDTLTEQGLRIAPHDEVERVLTGRHGLELVDIDETYQPVPPLAVPPGLDLDTLRRVAVPVGHGVLSDVLFTRGVRLDGYRLGRRGDRWVLAFRSAGDDRWWYVGDYATRERGVQAANALRAYLREVNLECEGMHVLEHVLLRPEGGARTHEAGSLPEDGDLWASFYPLRVSVYFSGWTARCRDEKFRLLAEETVRLNCPAHVHPDCHWLDVDAMTDFEKRYRRWLDVKADPSASSAARDAAAVALIRFAMDRRHETGAPERTG